MMRAGCVGLMVVLLAATGCSNMQRTSSLLLERRARGALAEELGVAQGVSWQLDPPNQVQDQEGLEVSVTFASGAYLDNLFHNRQVFGPYAGKNPFFPENIVFYVKIWVLFFLFAMVKAIVPRYRYDQLMRLGWKIFLPTSLVAVAVVAYYVTFLAPTSSTSVAGG